MKVYDDQAISFKTDYQLDYFRLIFKKTQSETKFQEKLKKLQKKP
jgi:hypothetical protein